MALIYAAINMRLSMRPHNIVERHATLSRSGVKTTLAIADDTGY